MDKRSFLSRSQPLSLNPILKESAPVRDLYCRYLWHQIRPWSLREMCRAQLEYYQKRLREDGKRGLSAENRYGSLHAYFYLIPLDMATLVGFQKEILESQLFEKKLDRIAEDLFLGSKERKMLTQTKQAIFGDSSAWLRLSRSAGNVEQKLYYFKMRDAQAFLQKEMPSLMITAPMSFGKSTLINALTGHTISQAQNMACTCRIYEIISKPFDDDVVSLWEKTLTLDAKRDDLLRETQIDEININEQVQVGTYFRSGLGGIRMILYDTPGVNSSVNQDHQELTRRTLQNGEYTAVAYVLNALQLSTTGDEDHLRFLSRVCGSRPVVFVLNRTDDLLTSGESVPDIVDRERQYLISLGFSDPRICPVSAKAAYLARKERPLSRFDQRELNYYLDLFEDNSLSSYYEKTFPSLSVPESGDELYSPAE